jgi:hypothetical protein
MSQITKADALLAVDAAMAALASARVLLEAIGEDPAEQGEDCPHARRSETFTGVLCRDCGTQLGVPTEEDPMNVDTISSEAKQ